MTKKRICVLQVTPEEPNKEHVRLFQDKRECDFFFVTHDKEHPDALKFCPNTKWAETRNTLAELVRKEYEYYAFIDYDYILHTQKDKDVLEQILEDLEKTKPAVMTFYPGKNLHTPYATNQEYLNSRNYSCIPFTHMGAKIIHHDLMDWFFPLCTNFNVDVDACHMFNIQEVPFLSSVVCSHNIVYDNGNSNPDATYNKSGAYSTYRMDEMWRWVSSAFKKDKILKMHAKNSADMNRSLFIKEVFVELFSRKNVTPNPYESKNKWDKIHAVFDLSHEFFQNKGTSIKKQFTPFNKQFRKEVQDILLQNVNFDRLKTKSNPWFDIRDEVNAIVGTKHRKITTTECVEAFQTSNNQDSFFIHNSKLDKDLASFLKGKTVAFVGPAPYLKGQNKGELIDSHDIVVRIQHGIPNEVDYGTRTDIIQSCLNKNYGPPVVEHIAQLQEDKKPKFIICNDTASEQDLNGNWLNVDEVYENAFNSLGVKMIHLKNEDDSWDRWALYWEIYAKQHIESFEAEGDLQYSHFSANFNSGYGGINFLLRYPIKKLSVFGVDFYNSGIPQTDKGKYNKQYTDTYGVSGTPYGPDKVLHDQLSQMMHCKNVLLNVDKLEIDKEVENMLLSESVKKRINKFSLLPKFKNETR
jgi:hypothetical protein